MAYLPTFAIKNQQNVVYVSIYLQKKPDGSVMGQGS